MPSPVERAQERLELLLGLPSVDARKAVLEVLDCFELDVDAYITARHHELQSGGIPNATIYQRLTGELRELRFRAPRLSVRQIRRRIYG